MLSLLSLNTNRNTQAARQCTLFKNLAPDVMCLQEAREDVFEHLTTQGYYGLFAPQWRETSENDVVLIGSAILSRLRPISVENHWFRGDPSKIPDFVPAHLKQADIPRAVQQMLLEHPNGSINVANLHFTWSAGGQPSDLQHEDSRRVAELLRGKKRQLLCGDFNAPLNGEIFRTIQGDLRLLNPPNLVSTVDPRFHYAKDLSIAVDALLSSNDLRLTDVHARFGVSDHCAFVAKVEDDSC